MDEQNFKFDKGKDLMNRAEKTLLLRNILNF